MTWERISVGLSTAYACGCPCPLQHGEPWPTSQPPIHRPPARHASFPFHTTHQAPACAGICCRMEVWPLWPQLPAQSRRQLPCWGAWRRSLPLRVLCRGCMRCSRRCTGQRALGANDNEVAGAWCGTGNRRLASSENCVRTACSNSLPPQPPHQTLY
jgi:hypothetical protein